MANPTQVYLGLGSNMGHRLNNLQKALFSIADQAGRIETISSVYESKAWGFEGGDFLNLCIGIQTELSPQDLMRRILKIEEAMGRIRKQDIGYASRIIDIDMLYYSDTVLEDALVTLPHPELHKRRFVLRPLADIAPQLYHPVLQKDTRNLLQECKDKNPVSKVYPPLYADRLALFSSVQFLAIEGNIGAGKTSLAKKIADDFNAKIVLERFADNPFLPKFYEDPMRYAFPLEMSFLADRYQQFTDDTSQFDLFKNFMVSDYDVYKSLIFAQITLQKDEFSLYRKIFNSMYSNVKKPDLYIYLYQNTERLLENIKNRGRSYEQEIAPDYLEKINQGYSDFIKGLQEQRTAIIDISALDFVHSKSDYELILEEIQGELLKS